MADQPKLSVVLPCYNEYENIVPLISALQGALSAVPHEIIVVDDSSPDGTADAVRRAYGGDARVKLIVRTADPGLAVSLRAGVEASTGDIIVLMDTDFNHSPADVPVLYHIATHVDVVVGSRFIFGGGMPDRLRYHLSYLYNIMLRWVLGTRIDDNLSGFIAIQRNVLYQLDFDKIFRGYGDYFFRLLLLSQRAGFRHIQVPVLYGERTAGIAKTRFLKIFSKYTAEVARIIWQRARGEW